jgi:hypothetical protein
VSKWYHILQYQLDGQLSSLTQLSPSWSTNDAACFVSLTPYEWFWNESVYALELEHQWVSCILEHQINSKFGRPIIISATVVANWMNPDDASSQPLKNIESEA